MNEDSENVVISWIRLVVVSENDDFWKFFKNFFDNIVFGAKLLKISSDDLCVLWMISMQNFTTNFLVVFSTRFAQELALKWTFFGKCQKFVRRRLESFSLEAISGFYIHFQGLKPIKSKSGRSI